eukprot:evm.model.scf_661.6 EVM.evm.TU.scf_661.6   scf_661:45589-48045(-)
MPLGVSASEAQPDDAECGEGGGLGRCSGSSASIRSSSEGTQSRDGADVASNLEVLSETTSKWLLRMQYTVVLIAFLATSLLFAFKRSDKVRDSRGARALHAANVAVASVALAALSTAFGWFLWRVRDVNRTGLRWTVRMQRDVVAMGVSMLVLITVEVFYLAPNAFAVANPGFYPGVFIDIAALTRTSLWVTLLAIMLWSVRCSIPWVDTSGRPVGSFDNILLDAPWFSHWKVYLLWGICQGLLLGLGITGMVRAQSAGPGDLDDEDYCKSQLPRIWVAFIACLFAGLCVFLLMYLYYAWKAAVILERRDYAAFRFARIALRYEFRTTGLFICVDMVFHATLLALGNHVCAYENFTWHGILPVNVAAMGFGVVSAVLYAPARPKSGPSQLVLEHSWTEKELCSHRAHLNGQDTQVSRTGKASFCFETAVKLYYWCEMTYEYDAALGDAKPPFSLETAMNLYSLENLEYLTEESVDSHALLAWSGTTIVLAFRGTYSTTNVWSDLKMWRALHPPARGNYWRGTQPLVHKGFLLSWMACDFSMRVLQAVQRVLNSPQFDRSQMRVLVTGHSLGGAVAQLAAMDIRRCCGVGSELLSVYTFGCPRLGNHAFAREYEENIPDSWLVINDLDAIARTPKLWVMYKHAGTRVVINPHGDMVVRPHFLEFKFTSMYLTRVKLVDHLLTGYSKSLSAVVGAQFMEYKGTRASRAAMEVLLREQHLTAVLGVKETHMHGLVGFRAIVQDEQQAGDMREELIRGQRLRLATGVLEVAAANIANFFGKGLGWASNIGDFVAQVVKFDEERSVTTSAVPMAPVTSSATPP